MARKQLAQTAAEKAAAAAADPFQPAPIPSGSSHSGLNTTQRYTRFATSTDEWEARNKTRLDALKEALAKKDKKKRRGDRKE